MNHQQAKELLLLYRPGTSDADDPEVAEALRLTKSDQELRHWFDEQCAVQAALRGKFKQISVPEGLREQIISERKAHLWRPVQRKVMLIAAGAGLAVCLLLLGVKVYWPEKQDRSFAAFHHGMSGMVLRMYPKMDLETNDISQIRQFLTRNQGHGDFQVSRALEEATPTGCVILPWNDKKVSMVCFNSGKTLHASKPDLFLFVVAHSAVKAPPPPAAPPQFSQIAKLRTASWSEGDKTYLLAAFEDEVFLKKYF